MSLRAGILGMGLVSPAAPTIEKVADAVVRRIPIPKRVESYSGVSLPLARISPAQVSEAASLPRLRRSSTISLMAITAARQAIGEAGLELESVSQMPVVMATSDGGVVYSRRFFEGVTEGGLGAGSPLLFPETVYNAPASHVAAAIGSNQESVTLVGDAATGLDALGLGAALLDDGCPQVLVLAASEADPLAALAYARWGYVAGAADDTDHHVLADCAAAIVLSREGGRVGIGNLCHGGSWRSGDELAGLASNLLETVAPNVPDAIALSCAGTPLAAIERETLGNRLRNTQQIQPKTALGESLAAGSLAATVACARIFTEEKALESALVMGIGFLGGVAALRLTVSDRVN